ncbi:MAG: hypothetical protein KFH87_00230, partial [Bacteroidetes bacterium]|nr:hypothetical protein [Bacteroidota bacterium]
MILRSSIQRVLLFLAIAGLPSLLSAQERARFLFDHFEVEHGLSQGSINALVQDAQGFLWIATDDGLNRFDGYQFLSFRPDPADEHSLLGNVITALAVDNDGCIWTGSSGIGVQRYDPRTRRFTLHPVSTDTQPASLANVSITTMRVDRMNRLWIGTREKGLYMYDKQTDELAYIPLDEGNAKIPVLDMAVTRSGTFVISSGTAGVFVVDPQRRSVRDFPLSEIQALLKGPADIVAAYVEGDRFLWLASSAGVLLRHDVRTGNWREFILSEHRHRQVPPMIRALTMDTAGRLWIATSSSGLHVLDPEHGKHVHLTADVGIPVSLPSDGLRCLHTDRLGNVWVGTNGSGLAMYSPVAKEFRLLSARGTQGPGLTVMSVRAIWQDSDSVLWLGGYGGFNRYDRRNGTVRTYPGLPGSGQGPYRGISSRNVYAIHPRPDRPGRFLVLGTEGDGLFEFDKHREVFRRISIETPDGSRDKTHPLTVYTMCQTRNGDLWLGSSEGLLHWAFSQGADRPVLLDSEFGPAHGGIHEIYEDKNGFLWIGTSRSGLALYDRLNGTVNFFTHRPGDRTSLTTNSITCIYEDKRGDFWVGTTLGLHLMNRVNATFRAYTTRDGLPNDVIYGILEDRAGYLWLSTNRGLTRFHRTRGVDATYDVPDGLQGNEFNNGAYFASAAGELFFGGVRGLTYFLPE